MAMVLANKTGKDHGLVFEFKAPVISTYEDIASGVEQGLVSKALVVAYFNHGSDLKCRAVGKGSGPNAAEKLQTQIKWANDDPDAYRVAQASVTSDVNGVSVTDGAAWDKMLRERFNLDAQE